MSSRKNFVRLTRKRWPSTDSSLPLTSQNRSVDAYLDEFIDLIVEAGYTDAKMVVIQFCKGLDPQIQNAIATMTNGRPSDMDTGGWYGAARTIDENKATNEAFRSSYHSPVVTQTSTQAPSCPAFNALQFPAPKPSGPLRETQFRWMWMPHERSSLVIGVVVWNTFQTVALSVSTSGT